MSEPFIAEIKIFAGGFAPPGYAFCNGQNLPIAQNTALFAVIGNVYGGDGETNFGLPDLQGRAPMHPGSGPGLTARILGQKLGTEEVGLSEKDLPQHGHALFAAGNVTDAGPGGGVRYGTVAMYSTAGNPQAMAPEALGPVGGTDPHNNMQPFLTLSFIIALTGTFPT